MIGEIQYTDVGVELINQMCVSIIKKYLITACEFCTFYEKKTIDSKVVVVLTKLWLENHGDVLEYCKRTWDEYSSHERSGIPREKRCNLQFSVLFVKGVIEKYKRADQKIGELSYVYLAAILNYFCLEIMGCMETDCVLTMEKVVEITRSRSFGPLIEEISIIM